METLEAISAAISDTWLNLGTGEGPSPVTRLVNSNLAVLLTKNPQQRGPGDTALFF